MAGFKIEKIISGGQTGADRAALDWALERQVPHGGWCPKGRKAEDGTVPVKYDLTETPSEDYAQRTEWNVRDSDMSVIFTEFPDLSGGSLLTAQLASKYRKAWIHLPWGGDGIQQLKAFLEFHKPKVLNIAGPRASHEPNVGKWVRKALDGALL